MLNLEGAVELTSLVELEVVENGQQAFDYYRNHHREIDLILMDCEMPEIDGYEATRIIRQFEQANSLQAKPILAITAHVLPELQAKCRESGMNDVIAKPIVVESLLSALRSSL